MKILSILVAFIVAVGAVEGYAFVPRASICSTSPMVTYAQPVRRATRPSITMGKVSKFGIFSPAVIGARKLLGEKRLNKLRGQGITLHSQVCADSMQVLMRVFAKAALRGTQL